MRRPARPAAIKSVTPDEQIEARSLREVILEYADRCFQDTDGVTRDAARMQDLMDAWHPNRTDREAGVRRNRAFDPDLQVVVRSDTRIYYASDADHSGQPALLFTIVSPGGGYRKM